nr:hypothetical protein Iba_chr10eCG0860 [Ipomoea batatas]
MMKMMQRIQHQYPPYLLEADQATDQFADQGVDPLDIQVHQPYLVMVPPSEGNIHVAPTFSDLEFPQWHKEPELPEFMTINKFPLWSSKGIAGQRLCVGELKLSTISEMPSFFRFEVEEKSFQISGGKVGPSETKQRTKHCRLQRLDIDAGISVSEGVSASTLSNLKFILGRKEPPETLKARKERESETT